MEAKTLAMFRVPQTQGNVHCCKCGVLMFPNVANMCIHCLRSEDDITEGLLKRVTILKCPECEKYLQPPHTWMVAGDESQELRAFCIKRLNLDKAKVRLTDAVKLPTESHSKRLKYKLTIQKEVLNGVILEQAYVVEYVVQNSTCPACTRISANPDQWVASVQLRQQVSHRRTFFYLEQVILKHDGAAQAIRIKQESQGVNFYFAKKSHADRFVDFVGKVVPVKFSESRELMSHDTKSNNYNFRYTFAVQICPICREDLICLPPKVATGLGYLGPLVICTKVSSSIMLLDPITLRYSFLDANQYWRTEFKSLLSSRQLTEYIVLDIDNISPEVTVAGSRYTLAEAQVARVSDFGRNDTIFTIRTHLGHLFSSGDYALGYDLYGANMNSSEVDQYRGLVLPDVILVKKSYEEKRQRKRGKPRGWKLKRLEMEPADTGRGCGGNDKEKMNDEYEKFLRDLEENPELRFDVSLYRNKDYAPSEVGTMTDGDDVPAVPLDELLADLDLSDNVWGDDDGNDIIMRE